MQGKSLLYGLTAIIFLMLAVIITNSQMQAPKDNDNIGSLEQNNSSTVISDKYITQSLMNITSSVFENNQNIPSKYTCDSENINPPLEIGDIPEETKSLALIVDDPDAPNGDWVHWVVFNIPPSTTSIQEGKAPEGTEGMTDFERNGWGGPCPPSGSHRYFFKLYALDMELDLDPSATKAELETAMTGHVLDRTELIGLYQRS